MTVTARPRRTALAGVLVGLFVFVVFEVVAVVMTHDNAGATFYRSDQIATAIIGVLAGAAFWPFTMPRLVADERQIRFRAFFGGWRTIPWSMVQGVEFPSGSRFARIQLPGGEMLTLWAVQRWDREQSIAVMRGLRELYAQAHPAASCRADGN